ncbi:hypothetical protein PV721_30330, partial [Streptomyces sp. MB09-01]|nr:hypothetical protein [Streptomyces sp. MB09-01]
MRRLLHIPAASALALTVGVLWWWAVLRLLLAPEESGAVEGAVGREGGAGGVGFWGGVVHLGANAPQILDHLGANAPQILD